ncbi:hypothetical protein BGZ88_009536 [Linnemannia elongata]|nr:hypothetical protein BGZ88_009536 [Linnemannia elongata]
MTTVNSATKEIKASKLPRPLDKATGKRKKKKLNLPVQTGPRRLTPKKMTANTITNTNTNTNTKVEASVEQWEHEEDNIEWIWGCAVEKPAEQDVTQEEERDSMSSSHVVKELRILEDVVAYFQSTCSRHKKKKTKPTKEAFRKVKITLSVQCNRESNTISTNTEDHTLDTDTVDDNSNEENKYGHKEQSRVKGEYDDKIKGQEPDNMLSVKEDKEGVTEEERKKKLGKRLQKDLEKGLRMQKNLHMKLQSQLKSQKDLKLMKAILTELEKGLKLQKMVENELGLRNAQGKGLDESDLVNAKVCADDAEATRVLPLLVDLQAPAA